MGPRRRTSTQPQHQAEQKPTNLELHQQLQKQAQEIKNLSNSLADSQANLESAQREAEDWQAKCGETLKQGKSVARAADALPSIAEKSCLLPRKHSSAHCEACSLSMWLSTSASKQYGPV